jgi:hypothetical protein
LTNWIANKKFCSICIADNSELFHCIGYTQSLGSWEDFYSDYDWIELPTERSSDNENVKAAAKHLGFNKTTWDTNATVTTDFLDWVNLTTTEQEAAGVLGYDECLWDREILDSPM